MRLGTAKPQANSATEWSTDYTNGSPSTPVVESSAPVAQDRGVEVKLHFRSGLVLGVHDVTGAVSNGGRAGVVDLERSDGQLLSVDLKEVVAYSLSHKVAHIGRVLSAAWRAR